MKSEDLYIVIGVILLVLSLNLVGVMGYTTRSKPSGTAYTLPDCNHALPCSIVTIYASSPPSMFYCSNGNVTNDPCSTTSASLSPPQSSLTIPIIFLIIMTFLTGICLIGYGTIKSLTRNDKK